MCPSLHTWLCISYRGVCRLVRGNRQDAYSKLRVKTNALPSACGVFLVAEK